MSKKSNPITISHHFLTILSPHKFFVALAIPLGLLFIVLTPPFQAPDEINHFYRAYQLSEGKLVSDTLDHRLGGTLPRSLEEVTLPFLTLRWNRIGQTSFAVIHDRMAIPLNEKDRAFLDFPNTARYIPVSYLPQSFAIYVLRQFSLSPLAILYGARVFTLLTWIFCIWLAIRIIPIYKWLFTLLALLPMSVFTNMSLSADVVTNMLAFLLIACMFKVAFQDTGFRLRDFLILAVLTVLLASAKLVYTPLLFLFLLIPVGKFRSPWQFYACFGALFVLGFGTALLCTSYATHVDIPYADYNPAFRDGSAMTAYSDMHGQVEYILSHRGYLFEVFTTTLQERFSFYTHGYIGNLGWLDTELPTWVVCMAYVGILLVALFEHNRKPSFRPVQRLVILFSLFSTIALILLSQLLTWESVGTEVIIATQGRYFIPVFPLLFCLCHRTWFSNRSLATAIAVLGSTFLLLFAAGTLYARYFATSEFESTKITCDAEELTSDGLFKTSEPNVLLENGITQSTEFSRSGRASAQLTPSKPFGFTFKFFDGHAGDIIETEVWRRGRSGVIVVAGDAANAFHHSSSVVTETDSQGWERLFQTDTLESNIEGKEVSVYLYNDKQDTSYFDDFSVTIRKSALK